MELMKVMENFGYLVFTEREYPVLQFPKCVIPAQKKHEQAIGKLLKR